MRLRRYLIALSIGVISCKQSTSVTPSTNGLTGTWIEKSARKDTIIFNLDQTGSSLANTLLVSRGRELNPAGYLAPKLGSGFYKYSIKGDTISVYDMYASTMYYAPFHIEQTETELYLDNFFEVGFRHPATATRTLVRLSQ